MPSSQPKHGQSFADVHPELVAQWSDDNEWTPEQTTPRSSRKILWCCDVCGHQWTATANSRSNGTGCPKCSAARRGVRRQKPTEAQSLAVVNPGVAAGWHPTKNDPLTAADVFAKSEVERWWLCPAGHVDYKSPKKRALMRGDNHCAVCNGRSVQAGFNDLATTHPQIADQWDHQRNTLRVQEVSAGSEREAWFVCAAGHHRKEKIKHRVRNSGCADCSSLGLRSRIEIKLECELAAVGVPVDTENRTIIINNTSYHADIYVPAWKLVIEFDGNHWHSPDTSVVRDTAKTAVLEKAGLTVVRIREALPTLTRHDVVVPMDADTKTITLATLYALNRDGYPLDERLVERYTDDRTLWAERGANRQSAVVLADALAKKMPDLAAELDHERNGADLSYTLTVHSGRRVWWTCSVCGHSWRAAVSDRTRSRTGESRGCPVCKGTLHGKRRRIPKEGKSLADLHTELVSQWDQQRNERPMSEYRPFSNDRAWWICPTHQHSYQQTIAAKTKNRAGCPICDGKQTLAGFNDVATTNPEVVAVWNTEKNAQEGILITDVTANSTKKVHWSCADCGVEKNTTVQALTTGTQRCRSCAGKRRKKRAADDTHTLL